MKSDIDNFKWLFQIEDDGRIAGKVTCVQLIGILKNYKIAKQLYYFFLILGNKKLKTLVTSSQLYIVFGLIYSIQGTKQFYLLLLWIVD